MCKGNGSLILCSVRMVKIFKEIVLNIIKCGRVRKLEPFSMQEEIATTIMELSGTMEASLSTLGVNGELIFHMLLFKKS